MVQCSFCGHENQNGSGVCEKCKTDLTVAAPVAASVSAPVAAAEETVTDTLHFDKIPLVQTLGPDASTTAEMTQPGRSKKDPAGSSAQLPIAEIFESSGSTATIATPTLDALPAESKPRLVVKRGEKVDMQYPIYPGKNYIGRTDEKPVDIDLENQEPVDRIWTSRQHAVITFENGALTIEDLNSLNGTFVNRTRVHPGQVRTLQVNDIIQIGTVQMRVILG